MDVKISQCTGVKFMNECAFGTKDPLYLHYHDEEWGQPIYDSLKLFKLIALESQHAGLSWLTILKKKESYEQAFYNFDPIKISKMTTDDIERLMTFPNIVHNRKKIEAIVSQAQGYFDIEKDYGSFSDFLWSFVDHKPIDCGYTVIYVPARNETHVRNDARCTKQWTLSLVETSSSALQG